MKRTPLQRKTPLKSDGPRRKRCPSCRVMFVPARTSQAVCGEIECAIAYGQSEKGQARAKKALADVGRREIKDRKDKLKSRAEYAKEAQAVINRYVRLRDAHLGCISCDKPASWGGQWHCSHFRSVGAAAHLRFNLWNMNKSCSQCNAHLSGNIMVYRPRLVEKIGAEKVEWLECDQELVRHEIPYLKRLKAVFAKKCRRLEARIQCNAA
ncbi:Bacteriophage Lambda NinG protein [Pseudomonas sp. LAMO17WK12:I10]|uniref:recombination protein NinG n=1 Tax=unclassified Pseudomonas TaxID=196821 RepID=UPI000BDCC974|nr:MULTISPECIES: recombination protein NinG [unclassified Pseudomonas]PXX59502.1 NinG protein [Pseudomonas sp. LAMO17WK12:I9]SNY46618.1 Bacteriophage Lambda NinG protein [Pseudomonas sp. LAMO17WK12:I10]